MKKLLGMHWVLWMGLVCGEAMAEGGGRRTCRVLFLGAPDGAVEKAWLHDGRSGQEVELPQMNLSPVYLLAGEGGGRLRLLRGPVAKGGEPEAGAPVVTLGAEVKDFYLLVTPDPGNPVLPVRLQVIDAGKGDFGTGQMLWYNLTDCSVGGEVGSRRLEMKPNSRVVLDAPAAGSDDYPVNLTFRMADNPRLYPLCETKWRHDPGARSLFFVIAQSGSRTPRVLGFPDHREAGQ